MNTISFSTIPSPPIARQLLTEKEVCAYLRVSKRNLFCWRRAGLIPFIKIGRAVRFRPENVEKALESMTIQTLKQP